MRSRFLVSVALIAFGPAATPAIADGMGDAKVTARPAPCNCQQAKAPVRKVVRQASADRVIDNYAQSYYDYQSASRVDGDAYRHHWRVAPQGYVEPMGSPPPDLPPYSDMRGYEGGYEGGAEGGYEGGYGGGQEYGQGYGYYDMRNGQLDREGFYGGVGYNPNGVDAGGGGGGGGTISLARPDGLNGPSYNSFGQGYGGAYGASNRLSVWRGYNASGGNGY